MGKTYRNFIPIGVKLLKREAIVRNSGKKYAYWTIYLPIEVADDLCLRNKQMLRLYFDPLNRLLLVKLKEKDYATHDDITRRLLSKKKRGRPMTKRTLRNSEYNKLAKELMRLLKTKEILKNKLKNKNISDEQVLALQGNFDFVVDLITKARYNLKKFKS